MRQSVVGRWRVGGELQVPLALVNARGLQLECAMVLFVPDFLSLSG